MAKDVGDAVRDALGHAVREAAKNAGEMKPKRSRGGSPLSGARGIVAGAGLAAAAPLAKKGVDAIRNGGLPTMNPTRAAGHMASKAGDRVGSKLKDAVSDKVDEAGGAGGLVKEAASGLLPGSGGDGGNGKDGMPGVGKGRRMPVQQSVDVAVELESVYNQFTQFEDWPQFMHRVTNVAQDDDNTIFFTTKIWGKTKEYTAEIVTQRPDDRIKWKVTQGITHQGVASFHELAPRLTRVEITLDVEPGSLIEKAARGMRHIKRAVRADLARFKAFMEMQEIETGAWRGVIEDGEVVEPHDDGYDEERDYSDVDDLYAEFGGSSDSDEDQDEDKEERDEPIPVEELPRDRTGRFKKGAGARPRSKTAAASSGSSARSGGGTRSRSSGSSSGDGSGNGKTKASASSSGSKSTGRRSSGGRSRGATNGSGSSSQRSQSSRRRSSSRS